MTEQISTLLLNALISAIVSFLVSIYFGEMAATKYLQKETLHREHDLLLVGEPLNGLRGSIRYYSDVVTQVYVNLQNGEISIPRMNITDRISIEEELLHEHLDSGYPQLLQSIKTYQDSYNGLRDRVNATYQKGMDLLMHRWVTEKELTAMNFLPERLCARILRIFKDEVSSRLFEKRVPIYALSDNDLIIWGTEQFNVGDEIEALQFVSDINDILEGPEIYEEIKKSWLEAESLREEREKIDNDLDRIIASVNAGVPFGGWCTVGIAANYEHSHG